MPRPPKGMTKEEWHMQRALEGKSPKEGITIRLKPATLSRSRKFCDQTGVSMSQLVEALLNHHLNSEGVVADRDWLVAAATKLTEEMEKIEKRAYFNDVKKAYYDLGGQKDGSNAQEICPMLYNHLGDSDASATIPFFEVYVKHKIQYMQVREELKKIKDSRGDKKP